MTLKKTKRKKAKPKPKWDPAVNALSPSTVGIWLTCREQFRLSVVERWRSRHVPIYFEYGKAVHACFQKAYMHKSVPKRADWLGWLDAYEKTWLSEAVQPTQKQLEQQEMIYGFLEHILPAYGQRWAGDWPRGKYPVETDVAKPHRWTGLEQRFRVNFEFEDGVVWPLCGVYDGNFRTRAKENWVFDSKCFSVIKPDEILETIEWTVQFWFYLWAIQKQGITPTGFLMNVVRRPGHRQGVKESKKDFFARVGKEAANPDNWDHWFQRYEMQISPKEIDEWEAKFLRPVLTEIRMWHEGKLPHYTNPNGLVTKYGRCEMFEPITKGSFARCYRRS